MDLLKDPKDGRKLLMRTTEKNRVFWNSHADENMDFFKKLFGELSREEAEQTYILLSKLMASFDKFYYEIRG